MFKRQMAVVTLVFYLTGTAAYSQVEETSGTPGVFTVLVDKSGSMDDPFPAPVQPRLSDNSKLQDVHRRLGLLADHLPVGTRVIVRAFDHGVEPLYDGVLATDADRSALRNVFQNIRSRGGSTFLWRTLDAALKDAVALSDQEPGRRVRVLLYSDGNDEEKAPGLDHNSIVKKYGKSLGSSVRLDWISIGYDVQGQMRQTLSDAGVQIVKADKPDDLDPLVADFQLSHSIALPGEAITLIDKSVGAHERWVDWGDGTPQEQLKNSTSATHTYQQAGENTIRYAVRNRSARTDRTSRVIKIRLPDVVEPEILFAKQEYVVGEELIASANVGALSTSYQWLLDGQIISKSPSLSHLLTHAGEATLILEVTDSHGRTAKQQKTIRVSLPAKPNANFRLATSTQHIDQPIIAINESSPSVTRCEWSVDGMAVSSEQHLEWTPRTPGKQVLRLNVWDRWEQQDSIQTTVDVAGHDVPIAKIIAPLEVEPGTAFQVVDGSTGNIVGEARWELNGKLVGTGRQLSIPGLPPGEHILKNFISSLAGEASAEHRVSVRPFSSPEAKFHLSSAQPIVGDVLRITDTTSGPVEVVHLTIRQDGHDLVSHEFLGNQTERYLDFPCDRAGELAIEIEAVGPGGSDRSHKMVVVGSRAIQPIAAFSIAERRERGTLEATFVSKSTGSFNGIEFDPGDGSGPRPVALGELITHRYVPGEYRATITLLCNEPGLTPATWTSEVIAVSQPMPLWISRLWWQIPLVAIAISILAAAVHFCREAWLKQQMQKLYGQITVCPIGKPLDSKSFELNAGASEQSVELDPKSSLNVTCTGDESSPIRATLLVDGNQVGVADLSEFATAQLGTFELSYET